MNNLTDRAIDRSAKAREATLAARASGSIDSLRKARSAHHVATVAHEEAQRETRGALRADHKRAATLHRQRYEEYADLVRKNPRKPSSKKKVSINYYRSMKISVNYYRSMKYRVGGVMRSLPIKKGYYVEIAKNGDVTALGPFETKAQAQNVAAKYRR